MRLLHTSDLHIGKRLLGFSLADDQRHMLKEIVRIAEENDVDAIVVAGDIYDSSVPPEESFRIFNDFITDASKVSHVYIIPGNHDSEGRLSVGNRVMDASGVHIAGSYSGKAERFTEKDDYGEIDIYLLPYITKSKINSVHADEGIRAETNDAAVKIALEHSDIDPKKRNVLVSHQHYAACGTVLIHSDSETDRLIIGNESAISAEIIGGFDYCALGHIHTPQPTGQKNAVYCGTPIKYDYSERNDRKHVNIVEFGKKGAEPKITEVPLKPLREMVCLYGSFREVYDALGSVPRNSQVYVTLTERDDRDRDSLISRCRVTESELFSISYEDNDSGSETGPVPDIKELANRSDMELFSLFFKRMKKKELSDEQKEIMKEVFDESIREAGQ